MAESLLSYEVDLGISTTLRKLNKFKTVSQKFNKNNEDSLLRQIRLQQRLNSLRGASTNTGKAPTQSPHQPSPKGDKFSVDKQKLLEKQKVSYLFSKKSLSVEEKSAKVAIEKALTEGKSIGDIKHQVALETTKLRTIQRINKETEKGTTKVKTANADHSAHLKAREAYQVKSAAKQAKAISDAKKLSAYQKTQVSNFKASYEYAQLRKTVEGRALATQIIYNSHQAKSVKQARELYNREMARLRTQKKLTKEMNKQGFLMQRMKGSAKQMVGTYASMFAAGGLASWVTRTGQDFQSVEATMLAVSKDTKEAKSNMKFLRDEAYRLGADYKIAAKGFSKMLAARGDMSLEDTKKTFTGLSEMVALLGLSGAEGGRAINAVTQMMSKGTINAEELRQQLGDVLPNAIQSMVKAAEKAGITGSKAYKEFAKAMKDGKLVSSKVLSKFAAELSNAAEANGGLKKALKGNRIAMNQLGLTAEEAGNKFFKAGYEEGLTKFFKELSALLIENEDLWKALGKISGSVLKGISWGIKYFIRPLVGVFRTLAKTLTDIFGDFSGLITSTFGAANLVRLGKFTSVIRALGSQMLWLGRAILLPITGMLELLELVRPTEAWSGLEVALGTNFTQDNKPSLTGRVGAPDWVKFVEDTMVGMSHPLVQLSRSALSSDSPINSLMSHIPFGNESAATPQANVTTNVIIGGEQVASAVTQTPMFESAVDRRLSNYQVSV